MQDAGTSVNSAVLVRPMQSVRSRQLRRGYGTSRRQIDGANKPDLQPGVVLSFRRPHELRVFAELGPCRYTISPRRALLCLRPTHSVLYVLR